MFERLRTMLARPGARRLHRTGRRVLAATVAWLATGQVAAAAERDQAPVSTPAASSCLDELVDVYLSPLKREEGPPIRVFLKPGPPPVHLRLPRRRLRMEVPDGQVDTENCDQKAFSGRRASYLRASDLAHGLSIPYDQPKVKNGQFFFRAPEADKRQLLVDDSGDREGTAQNGTWIVNLSSSKVNGRFCLTQPAPEGFCYARTEDAMVYDTGHVSISAQAFSWATFGPPATSLWTQITVADLDRYFALLRQIADAVVVAPAPPP